MKLKEVFDKVLPGFILSHELKKRIRVCGSCVECKQPLMFIEFPDLLIAFCLNCGWVLVVDHGEEVIDREVDSAPRLID